MTIDPDTLVKSLAADSAWRRIIWLRYLADRLEHGEKTDITDINGLRSLAVAFERGLSK